MITSWALYWLLMLDNIKMGMQIFLFLGAFINIVFIAGLIALEQLSKEKIHKMFMRIFTPIFLCIYILIGIIQCLTPSTKDAMIIYGVPKIVNNETIQKEFGDIYYGSKKFITVLNDRIVDFVQVKKEKEQLNEKN